ncbi:MAG: amidohydrolase family protein [Clostridia bacterium]|nr:amidohydrolase family protein [Clostridia bacterium]
MNGTINYTGEIIDVHTHVFPPSLAVKAADNTANYYGLGRQGDGTAECLLRGAEGLKNKVRFVVSSAALHAGSVSAGNSYLASLAAGDSRFIPLASFHPDMGLEAAEAELTRAKAAGAKGIKLHCDFQGFAIDDERAVEIYRVCARLGLPVLFLVGDRKSDLSHPRRLIRAAERVPELTVIAAHMGGYSVWDEAEKYIIGQPVYVDTSEALLGMDAAGLYRLIQKHGVERVMFGSDYPLWFTGHAFQGLEQCALTPREKALVYCETAKKVFGIGE